MLATVALVAICGGRVAWSQAGESPTVRVTGIVSQGPLRQALVEIQPARPGSQVVRQILGVGERTAEVEIVSIDERQGVVTVKQGPDTTAYMVQGSRPQSEARTFNFAGADLSQVLDVYQELSGLTVVRGGQLPAARVDLRTDGVLAETEAVRALEAAMTQHGLVAVPVGKKFVCVTSAGAISEVNELPPLPPGQSNAPPGLKERTVNGAEVLPPGMLKFQATDPFQILDIYQELSGRTVLPAPRLSGKVTVRSQTPVSRAEAVWLLEVALQLNGTRVIREGQKFAFALPVESKAPPAVRSNAELVPKEKPGLPAGGLKFWSAHLPQVLDVYAALCGRKAAPGGSLPSARISVRSQTELTAGEAIYALDALVALQGVEFVAVGDQEITARPRTAGPQ